MEKEMRYTIFDIETNRYRQAKHSQLFKRKN